MSQSMRSGLSVFLSLMLVFSTWIMLPAAVLAADPYTPGAGTSSRGVVGLDPLTLTYDGNGNTGGTAPEGGTYTAGDLVTVAGAGTLVRTHYAFAGWNTAADGNGTAYAADSTFNIDANTTLYAQWTQVEFTISYKGNGSTGGSVPTGGSYAYNTTIAVAGAGTLVRTHYTFAGWDTAADGSGTSYDPGDSFNITVDTTLYAQWTPVDYTLAYNGNGSTGGTVPDGGTYTYNTPITVAGAGTLVRTHYTFAGWNTAANGSGTAYAADSTFNIDANTTLYAQWTPVDYTLAYNGNGSTGGTVPTGGSYAYNTLITVAGAGTMVRTHYIFAGWNTAANGSGTAYDAGDTFNIDVNTTLFAQWTLADYTLAYNGNGSTGGTVPDGGTYPYNTLITVAGAGTLVRTHYTFAGWNTAANGSGTSYAADSTFNIDANTTLYAQWTPVQYTLNYNGNGSTGGTVPTGGTYAYNTLITVAGAGSLVRTNYIFNGWNTAADGSGTAYSAGVQFNLDANTTLYAQWATTPVRYTLAYNGNGNTSGTVPSGGGTFAENTLITIAGAGTLVRTDYNFVGWNTAANGSGTAYAAGAQFNLTADITLYAQWSLIQVTVTFDKNGGNTEASTTQATTTINGTVALPVTDPTRIDYVFAGWNTAADGSGTWFTSSTPVTASLTVYAHWLQSPVSGLVAANGGYNSLRLNWTATGGAAGYEVYRATAKAGPFTKIADATTASYTDSTGLTTGKKYYYQIRAYAGPDTDTTYSDFSDIAGKAPVPARPGSFKVSSKTYTSLKLSWTAVNGASGYKIYRSTTASGTYTLIKTITSGTTTSYTNSSGLTLGKTYYYKMRAYTMVSGNAVLGTMTADGSAKVMPGKTSSYTVEATTNPGELLHTWAAVTGATGYQIWRSDSADGPFTKVKTVKGATTWTETGLTSGQTYYYKIRAYRTVSGTNYFGAYTAVIREGTPQ